MAGFDKYVTSLLQFNKDNLKSLIKDEVKTNTWQLFGQPKISKENAKFNSSYQFYSGEVASFRLDKKIPLGDNRDFTLDFWICNKNENSSGILLNIYNNELFSRLAIFIEDSKLRIQGVSKESRTDCYIDLSLNELSHIGISCYSEISRLYIYKNGYKHNTMIFKIPEGNYNVVFGNEINSSNLDLSISEIRMSDYRRWQSNFSAKLNKEFISDNRDIFFLKFKESVIDSEESSKSFSVDLGYYKIIQLHSPFKRSNSLYLFGNSRLESNSEIQLGGKDFCIDGWVYIETNFDKDISIIFEYKGLKFLYDNLNSTLKFLYETNVYSLSGILNNTLFHFALVFRLSDNSSISLYLNGQNILRIEGVNLFDIVQSDIFIYGNNLKGYLSELRISSGVPRFLGNFKLPRLPYSRDTFNKSTAVLLHLNKPSLYDERGNYWQLIDESIHFTKEGAKLSKAIELFRDSQYLYLSDGLVLGLSDFTIEFWTTSKFYDYNYSYLNYFKNSQGTLFSLIDKNNTQFINLSVLKDNIYRLSLLIDSNRYTWDFRANFNNLYHIAIEYISNQKGIKLYLNGQSISYQYNQYILQLNKAIRSDRFRIYLGNNSLGNDFYQGTFNDFRVSNILRYLGEFIPDRREFIPDQYTLSLLHLEMSAQQDLIGNKWKLLQGSSSKVLSTNSSMLFNNALNLYKHQYLKMKNPLYLGGQDFTLDFFVTIASSIDTNGNIFELNNLVSNFSIGLRRYKNSQGICLRIGFISDIYNEFIFKKENLLDKLLHIAIIYIHSERIIRFYINGKEHTTYGEHSINCYIERQLFDSVTLGKSLIDNKEGYFEGNIDEFRIIDGVALWTKDTFNIPLQESQSLTNIDKFTESLFHFDEYTTKDESGKLWIEGGLSVGVKLSSLKYNFPYQSAYFDGNSGLRLLNKIELGDLDFFIDFYISLERLSKGSITKLFQMYNNQFTVDNAIHCYLDNESRQIYVSVNYSDRLKSQTKIDFNRFYRVSILFRKSLNIFVLYIDNLEEDYVYYSMKSTVYANLIIGHSGSDKSYYHWYNSFFTGYIDKFQITVLNTSIDNFFNKEGGYYLGDKSLIVDSHTKSLLQFKDYRLKDTYKDNSWNLKGDSILLHLDETFLDDFVNNTWEKIGNPLIAKCPKSLFSDESISYAYYNNGKDFNYLCNNNIDLNRIFNNDFTLDFWVYLESIEHNQGFVSSNMSEYYWEGFVVLCANKNLRFAVKFNNSWKDLDFFRLEEKEWIHIALVRRNNILYGYKNGILKNSYEINDFQGIDYQLNIGYWYRTNTGYGGLLDGYLREVRVINKAIWTGDSFILPFSKRDSFYLIDNYSVQNSITLLKNQYLERELPVELSNNFSIEAYLSLEENQTFFLLEGLERDSLLSIKSINKNSFLLIINQNSYEISIENIRNNFNHIAVEYIRNLSKIRIYINNELIKVIESSIGLEDTQFKVSIGKELNTISEEIITNGIKRISEFRISDILRDKYLLKEQNMLPLQSEEDLVLLLFKESVTRDEVLNNQWKVEGERDLTPKIVEDFSYSRFGSSIYLVRNTCLILSDLNGFTLEGDFTVESWVYLLGESILFSARDILSKEKFIIKLAQNLITIWINDKELNISVELKDLFHIAVEYQNQDKLLLVYLNGKEVTNFRDITIPYIRYSEVIIGLDRFLGNSNMYLDEFRISRIARWKGNFLLEVQPYSLLSFNKKLAVRDRVTGLIDYISLYYDLPERGYSIFDSGVEIYADLAEVEDDYLKSKLMTRIDNISYMFSREVIKRTLRGLNYFYRFNKIKNDVEYSRDGIEGYRAIKSLLGVSKESAIGLFNLVLIMEEDIENEELNDFINIYRNISYDDEYFTYYQLSFIQTNSEAYLSYRVTEDNTIELILDRDRIAYRIIGQEGTKADKIGIKELDITDSININEKEETELSYKIIDYSTDTTERSVEFRVIGKELNYRVTGDSLIEDFSNDIDRLIYRIGEGGIEFLVEGEWVGYRVTGDKEIEFSIEGEGLIYQIFDRSILFNYKEKILQLYLLIKDYNF